MATYDIDLLRAVFVDKLNDSSIFLASFYEQIQEPDQIERYVENIKELLALQNREQEKSNYKAMGIIAQSGNAEIINIKTNYVSPLEYQARFEIELSDRDYVLGKLKTLIDDLRGRKFDLALLTNGEIKVIANPTFNLTTNKRNLDRNFLLFSPSTAYDPTLGANNATFATDILNQYTVTNDITWTLYMIQSGKLYRRTYRRTGSVPFNVVIGTAVEIGTIDKLYKLSLSFDGIQSQEPFINNGLDRVFLFFGGSATIVESKVTLGNDIILTTIQVGKDTGPIYEVEPTEIPASLSVSDDTYQDFAGGYRTVDRNMAVGNKLSYAFIYDNTNALYNGLYEYSRYGTNAGTALVPGYTQQIFTIKEYRHSFGVLTTNKFYAKLGDVSTSNTNGDVMTITATMKIGAY